MNDLVANLNKVGFEPQFFDDVIYIQKETRKDSGPIDVFFFPFGCITIWGAEEEQEKAILADIVPVHGKENNELISDFIYFDYDEETGKTFIDEEKNEIILGDKSTFIKLSISHALAQSVKLSVLEQSVSNLIVKTTPIQQELARTGSVSLSKKEISQQIGILFNERYSINLHSDILDTPEFFWRRPSYEPLYLMTVEFQDIQIRQNILNHRLSMIHELYNILSNDLNYKHSTRLEWIIIILITMEVVLSLAHDNLFFKIINYFIK
ncbi:RMD1 family protein [Candidatus Tisiphia endosymbiont of Beris chalybata]|uniref:RMD1 family protein n=1 Tax=Candidatus Tisiphia endosymbiont of Beris chalybata TaxID=3066262 RepID=UPI00312C6DA0